RFRILLRARSIGRSPGATSATIPVRSVEPATQLPFLPACQPRHLTRRVGTLLDQRERLQHRIVQMRRDRGPLVRADTGLAFLAEITRQTQPERHREYRNPQ